MSRYILIRRLRWPAVLLLIGVRLWLRRGMRRISERRGKGRRNQAQGFQALGPVCSNPRV